MLLNQFIDKTAQDMVCLHAVKTVRFLASAICNHSGETAHAVPPGDAHVLVGIPLGQQKLAAIFFHQFLKTRSKHFTGGAPLGTDIEQYRRFIGSCDHQFVEVGFLDVIGMNGMVHSEYINEVEGAAVRLFRRVIDMFILVALLAS